MLLAHGARSEAPDKGFERVGQTPLVDRPGGVGNALIQALTWPQGADVALVRVLVNEAGIDAHEGYFAATACFEGTGTNGLGEDAEADDEGWQDETELEAAQKAREAREADIPGTDFSTDLVAPSIPASFPTINTTYPYVSPQTGKRYHYTPLHLGARFDRLPILCVLLNRGANPSILVLYTGRSVFFSGFTSLLRLYSYTGRLVETNYGGAFNGPLYRNRVREIDVMGFGLSYAGPALLALGARPGARNNAGEIPTDGTSPTTTRRVKGYREFE
ncbi:hypothetical protein Sste5344_004394 [Sporothrix stenoceras]